MAILFTNTFNFFFFFFLLITINKLHQATLTLSSTENQRANRPPAHAVESFHTTLAGNAPKTHSTDTKLRWLRSQIIGQTAEFNTPFGARRITYADSTASGRCLGYVEDYIQQHVLPFYGNIHTSHSYVGQRTTKIVHEAAEYVKRCLGGGRDDALLFCGSGATAAIKRLQEVIGIAIPSTLRERVLDQLIRQEERWVVFIGPYEHHSNILSWRQSLAEVIEIDLDENGLLDMEALKTQLGFYRRTGRPMLGSFCACSNVNGICSDTRALARVLHSFGAFACFDFAASGPYVEIDMRSGEIDGYDAIVLSPHKFIGGPGSPGILLMSKALYQLGSSPPSTCGGGTVNFANCYSEKDTIYVKNIEEREDAGTPPIIQKVRAALAFWVKEYIGYEEIAKQEKDYVRRALERLLPNPNIGLLGNTSVERQAILSFLVYTTTTSSDADEGGGRRKPLHGPFVAKLLNDLFGIQARGGCACAAPYGHRLLHIDERRSLAMRSAIENGYSGIKPGWTRISFPYYMSNEEFEFTLSALEFIATYGQRFLPLYTFDWKSGNWAFKVDEFKDVLRKEESCKFCNTLSAHTMMAFQMEEYYELHRGEKEAESDGNGGDGVLGRKYRSYLETAKHIANLLPKSSPSRPVPEDLDLELVPFRV